MKKTFIYKMLWMPLFCLIVFTGCQDLEEDPKSLLTTENFLNTEEEMEGAVAAMYYQIARDVPGWGFTFKSTPYFGSDDFTTDPGLNKASFREFDRLQGTAENNFLRLGQWDGPMITIYQANYVLEALERVELSSEYENGAEGQARFWRAICYYYLVRTFGDLPVVTGTSIEFDNLPERSPVSEIYDIITSDLDLAEDLLPASWTGQPGKPTKWAAKALYADVLLTMGGWPLNRTDTYTLSAVKAKEVMDSGAHSLLPNYLEVFTTNNHQESVFSLQYNLAGGLPQRAFGSSCVPLEEVAESGNSGWQDFCAEINFFLDAPDCQRTDDTFYTTLKLRQPDGTTNLVSWDSELTRIQHPYYKKFRAGLSGDGVSESDTEIFNMGPSTNKTLDVIRYASVLLNYAEASALANGGPTGDSYAAINEVRQRAGLADLTPGLNQADFVDAVVYEKAYEHAGEFGKRWFDIQRLQLLPEVIARRHPDDIALNPAAVSNPAPYYLAPLPVRVLARNPSWSQNPGY